MTNDELKALCESNARAIHAQSNCIAEASSNVDRLTNTVTAFIDHVSAEGLQVSIIAQSANDTADEALVLERDSRRQDVSITALRRDVITDRQAFREQAEANRAAFREALESDRTEWRTSFEQIQNRADTDRVENKRQFDAQLTEIRAIGEHNRALLSALATTNRRVDNLEQAS